MKKGLIYALVVILLDQITKTAAVVYFTAHPGTIRVTPFFNLVLAWNKGVSFSMLHTDNALMPWVLVGVSLLISAVIVHWMFMEKDPKTINGFGLILGGALGNVIDRLHYRAVVDFLDFHVGGWHWPAFNVADSAICIGAAIILILNVFMVRPEKAAPEKEEKNDGTA
ncbi:MAG: signal peptidase II [Alphaproteobacteria bacterium]|jgi:signal peptidase II